MTVLVTIPMQNNFQFLPSPNTLALCNNSVACSMAVALKAWLHASQLPLILQGWPNAAPGATCSPWLIFGGP